MTDREKIIKALECRLDINGSKYKYCLTCDYRHDIDHCQWACQTDGILEDVLALLKAQEPVEPVVDKNTSTGECEDPWGRLFFCGACGKRINEKYDPDEDDKYCKHCGRAVKWE